MSRASEWAASIYGRGVLSPDQLPRDLVWSGMDHDPQHPYSGFTAYVGTGGDFGMCGYQLSPNAAVEFARWIIDTFGDGPYIVERVG